MRVEQQKAYVIHTKPFRDTSLLVDCYTQQFGRIALIAKGARSNKSHQRSLLQPFHLLSISWQGRGSLKTLIGAESLGLHCTLEKHFLYSGLYINELFLHLLATEDTSETLFERYHELLVQLDNKEPLEPTLRKFEFDFLQELGYGIDFFNNAYTGEPLEPHKRYTYILGQGFIEAEKDSKALHISGALIKRMAENNFENKEALKPAKYLTRLSIDALLEGKSLKSREFFKQLVK